MELESRGAVSDVSEHKEKKFESEDLGQTIQERVRWCMEWIPRETPDWGTARAVNSVWSFWRLGPVTSKGSLGTEDGEMREKVE